MAESGRQICIIDYGSGNIRSVYNIFKSVHNEVKVSNDINDIQESTHIVLPGVGAFGAAMEKIKALDAFNELRHQVLDQKKWYLGICVGMQILADSGSEYGHHQGLGWIAGAVDRMKASDLKLPHVGWNNFEFINPDCPLFKNMTPLTDFYYVHSFAFAPAEQSHLAASCSYGSTFACAVWKDNIFGVQFHPEKSQKAGIRLLENFIKL